jgi:hypothetical protein
VQPPSATSPPPRVVGEPEPPQPCLAHPPTSTDAPPLDLVVPHCLSRRPRPCRHRAPGTVTAQGRAVPAWAIQAVSAAGPGRTREASGRKPTQRCVSCFRFFIFVYNSRKSYRVLKYVENTTLLEKNMKPISIESLRVDLGIRLEQSHFCMLLPYVKLLQLQH